MEKTGGRRPGQCWCDSELSTAQAGLNEKASWLNARVINERPLNFGINQMLSLQEVASQTPPLDQSGCQEAETAGTALSTADLPLALLHHLRIGQNVSAGIRPAFVGFV